MPFETPPSTRSVAVIGGGISGMGAAHALAERNRVVLFEAEPRLGGHARTRPAGRTGELSVDTGFIVFNHVNYPNLTALFDQLEVPVRRSDMSFGASLDGGKFEYGLRDLRAVLAQPSNLARRDYLGMLRDLFRFNREALEASREPGLTVGGLVEKLGLGTWFRDRYLLPVSGAIWSTPKEGILDFPAASLVAFFRNHNLLQASGQHTWYTVAGGSMNYVSRLARAMERRGVEIRSGTPVQSVRRGPMGVEIRTHAMDWELFDEVVFATHSDDSLRLLDDPTEAERLSLGAIRYQPNEVILHGDASLMPRRRAAWSSWVYTEDPAHPNDRIDLTYWMNSLQRWLADEQVFVTLNTTRPIDEGLVWDTATFRHPVYDTAAIAAQKDVAAMNGANRTWYCGAWMGYGFHEDGLASGLDVARQMEAQPAMRMAAE